MAFQKKKDKDVAAAATSSSCSCSSDYSNDLSKEQTCINRSCFFCIMKEPDSSLRRVGLAECFKEMPLTDDQEHVLAMSSLWNIAMTQPDDSELPSLGIFKCMADMITRGVINDREWLLSYQNIYIPYYAAHVIGSYTMNKVEFAEHAVESGVLPPLIELMKGKMSWVEQRVAVRALGHLASYESTFDAVAAYEEEVVSLAMQIASTCLDVVYVKFVAVKDKNKRSKYHIDLLTRGIGGIEIENRKAEEWASQLQCWSIYILNCFASKQRSLDLICKQDFLKDLCEMWGGLMNHSSPAGVGLIRILCYSKHGRKNISQSKQVLQSLCNLSRSSDDWQYMGIDCLLLLLNDPDTRSIVIEIATMSLVDLVDLRILGDRSNIGETITRTLLLDYKKSKSKFKNKKVHKGLEELWSLMVERRKREKMMPDEKVEDLRVFASLIKQEANKMFRSGDVEEAIVKYSEALDICPLRFRKERMVLYSNRAQCNLILNDPDAAIGDSTRALCLSNPANSHRKSLWRRSQAYDMKGLAKESLMDSIMFINGFMKSEPAKGVEIPYYAARMMSKQMEATWLFASAKSKISDGIDEKQEHDAKVRVIMQKQNLISGLSTIIEESVVKKGGSRQEKGAKREKDSYNGSINASQIGSSRREKLRYTGRK